MALDRELVADAQAVQMRFPRARMRGQQRNIMLGGYDLVAIVFPMSRNDACHWCKEGAPSCGRSPSRLRCEILSFGLFLPKRRYSRLTLVIRKDGNMYAEAGSVPESDKVRDEPQFTPDTYEEVARRVINLFTRRG